MRLTFLVYRASLAASPAIFSNWSWMKEFRMEMALELIPVSGCTCFSTCATTPQHSATLASARFRQHGAEQRTRTA